MSIAELIMTGTERASKSTDWVADSLAKIGDNVSKVLTEREQNRQAQEMLPFLKQNLQAAMTDAENGKPGQAYSKLLGSLDTQTLKIPQLADFVKLGFNAIGQTMDAQKTGGTSLVDFFVAKELGLPLPTGGGGGGGAGGTGGSQDVGTPNVPAQIVTGVEIINAPGMEDVDTTQGISAVRNNQFSVPVQGKDNKTYYAQPRMDALPVDGGTEQPMPGEPVVTSKQPLTYAEAAKAKAVKPTPAQEKATEFVYKNEAIAETQGVPKAWYNQAIDPASPKIKELSQTHEPIDLEGGDRFGFGTMYLPIQRDQEMTITGKGNDFNFSKTVNKRDPKLAEDRVKFIQNMNNALSILDGSAEMQTLLDQYGSIDNFPKYKTVKDGIVFPLKDGKKSITLRKGTQEQPGLMESWRTLQNAPGMGRAIGILIARSGETSGSSSRSKENLAELLR
jgi:hypothetical protein